MDKIKTRKAIVALDIRLGEKVIINAKLVRSRRSPDRSEDIATVFAFKSWQKITIKPREVIVIGRRSLQNGRAEYGDEGSLVWFKTGDLVPAYLVVENMRRAPFYIPVEAIAGREAR